MGEGWYTLTCLHHANVRVCVCGGGVAEVFDAILKCQILLKSLIT